MTYNLLTVAAIGPETVAVALAGCFWIAAGEVDVADPDGDPDLRNWDAPVLCDYRAVHGDLARSLDIYAQGETADQPLESELAAGFAKAAGTAVLFPAEEAPPGAYWVVTPEGLLTRARLEPSDDEPPLYSVTAVEAPVPHLPRAAVTRFAEIVREQRPDTPLAHAFAASVEKRRRAASDLARSPDDDVSSALRSAKGNLVVWERVIRQMESGWAPAGWYPASLYRERLEARDELSGIGARLPREVSELLGEALAELDRRFAAATEADPSGGLRRELTGEPAARTPVGGWWWRRRPDPRPWEQD
ncbi:hypothetical protein OV450_2606 [Actinobacteria bacterium OV450]|nr:hypothetical protein OV450_2606 [Actinobacteria bacterium OV450]